MQTPHRKPRRQLINYNPRIPARFIVGPHSPIIPFVLMFFASCVCAHNKINRQKRLRRSSWCELKSTTTSGRRRRGKRRKIESFLRLPPSVHRLLWIWKIFSFFLFLLTKLYFHKIDFSSSCSGVTITSVPFRAIASQTHWPCSHDPALNAQRNVIHLQRYIISRKKSFYLTSPSRNSLATNP